MAQPISNESPTAAAPAKAAPAPLLRARRKKKGRTGLIVGIVLLLLLLVAAVMLLSGGGKTKDIIVDVDTVRARTISQTVTATGVIDPQTQVKVSPEVSGEIVYLGVEEGATVRKGEVLVRINPQSMLAERDEAQAQISGAQSRMMQSEAQLMRNQQDLTRVQALFDKKLATAQELEAAQAQVKIATSDVSAARYTIAQTQAGFRRVRQSLSKTTIVAPISGVVTKLSSKVGEKVVGAIQMSGTEIMTVADLSVIEAVVNVSENDVVQVSLGDTADVEVDAIPGQKFKAVVTRIANSPKQSGAGTQEQVTNFEVRLRFVLPDQRFRPGMTATATILTEQKRNVQSVPIQSVTARVDTSKKIDIGEEGGAKSVTLEKAQQRKDAEPTPIVFVKIGGIVRARPVKTGIRDDQFIEIIEGLRAGEIVVSGSYKAISKELHDSSHVALRPKVTVILGGDK